MPPTRFETLMRLHERALELAPEERPAFLDAACGDDADLRDELERMLAVETAAPEFLELPTRLSEGSTAPERVGSFRILRAIGSGGMGLVYEARQESPERLVALKMMHVGLGAADSVRRFRFEAEVLGRLRHPGIAQVHEAGVHVGAGGIEVPYFAMEYVEGATDLLTYARREALPLRRRIGLFLAVCDAVQHGHQQGVVHRDLKPANVLVGADGRPKVIDFGIARVLAADEALSRATRTGEILGTLTRMSPEQLAGDPKLVDTRTDVYALGLMLYELVWGRLPYDVEDCSWTDVARVICDRPPLEPWRIDRSIPRDLGWIALRALEKERERRYASVSELAADLERWRRDEPVLAGPPSGAYRMRKLFRRHRVAFGAAGGVGLALLAGTVLATLGMLRARDAESAARAEAVRANTLKDLSTDVFRSIDAYHYGADVRMVDVLRDASLRSERLAAQPAIEAEYRALLGGAFAGLGEPGPAREHLERASELYARLYGPSAAPTLAVRRLLAVAWVGLRRPDEARRILDDVIARGEAELGPEHAETVRARALLASSFLPPGSPGRLDELRALAPKLRAACGVDDPQSLGVARELAFELAERGQQAEALASIESMVDQLARELPEEDPRMIDALDDRAILRRLAGDLEGAERDLDHLAPILLRRKGPRSLDAGLLAIERAKVKRFLDHDDEALEIVREQLDRGSGEANDADPVAALLRFELGVLLQRRGEREEAESVLGRSIDGCAAAYGDADVRTLNARAQLASLWSECGRVDDAVALLFEVVEATERTYGQDSRMLVEFLVLLAPLATLGEPDQGLEHAARAARIARATLPPAEPARAAALRTHGALLLDQGRSDEAEEALLAALGEQPTGAAHADEREELARALARLYEARGDERSAAKYRELAGPE